MRPLLRVTSTADLIALLARHRGKMLVSFLLAVTGAVLYGMFGTKIYRSEAQVLLRLGHENTSLDPTATVFRSVNVSQSRLDEVNSELQILTSIDLRERVVDAIGPEKILGSASGASRDAAVSYLERNSRGRLIEDSYVLEIEFEHRDPKTARAVVEAMLDVFQQKHVAAHASNEAYEFLAAQVRQLDGQIAEREAALAKVRQDLGAASVADGERALSERIHGIETDLAGIESDLAGRRAARDAVANGQEVRQAVASLQTRLQQLQVEELQLRGKGYLPDSRGVASVRGTIDEVEQLVDKTRAEQREVVLQVEDSLIRGLEARAAVLRQQLDGLRGQLQRLGETALVAGRYERELETLRTNHRRYLEGLEQARIEAALRSERITNLRVLQPAVEPRRPVRPSLPLCVGAGILLGLFAALGVMLFAEMRDDRVYTLDDVGNAIAGSSQQALPWAFQGAAVATLARGLRTREGSPFVAHMAKRLAPIADRLQSCSAATPDATRAYAVTGTDTRVGTTTTAMLLAAALSRQQAGPVLLVDADFSTGGLSARIGHALPGLTNLVSPKPGAQLWRLAHEQIHFLGIGTGDRLSAATVDPNRLVSILRLLQRRFGVVVFDLPPLLEHEGAWTVAGLCDATLVVAEAGATRMGTLARVCARVEAVGSVVGGVVLNKSRHDGLPAARAG